MDDISLVSYLKKMIKCKDNFELFNIISESYRIRSHYDSLNKDVQRLKSDRVNYEKEYKEKLAEVLIKSSKMEYALVDLLKESEHAKKNQILVRDRVRLKRDGNGGHAIKVVKPPAPLPHPYIRRN